MHQVFVSDSGRFDVQVKEQSFHLPYRRNAKRTATVHMVRDTGSAIAKPVRRATLFRVGEFPSINIAKPKPVKRVVKAAGKRKPKLLSHARRGKPDDLKLISGLGPVLEQTLNELGVYHFDQIANWDAANLSWIEENWGCGAKVKRDNWVAQAKKLAK